MYRDLDQDRDGKITRNEIRGFLLNLTDRKGEVERFLEAVDEDNKGFVLHEGGKTCNSIINFAKILSIVNMTCRFMSNPSQTLRLSYDV